MTERPVECSHCKRPIKSVFKEIVGDSINITEVCGECPILQQKLHGQPRTGKVEGLPEVESGLCCGNCRTTLESVLTGNPLGCSECYAVFSDVLVSQLIESHKIPAHLQRNLSTKKTQPIHIGKSPNKPITIAPSSRLTALNEALNEALKRENYEQAAWLRDQIKALMDKPNEGKS
ncbi:MAG TPA: UvrB/UvrC motif-containing protein [Rhabdochlamydiaceae bacterium]|nr:UvrB/UvrC motif-containing protein [Rhabdochlamydiaceae bacterium]